MRISQWIGIDEIIVKDELSIHLEKVYEELRELMGEYRRRFEDTDYEKYKKGLEKNREALENFRKERRIFRYVQEKIEVHRVSLENNRILLA